MNTLPLTAQLADALGPHWGARPGHFEDRTFLKRNTDGLTLYLRIRDNRLVVSADIVETVDENDRRLTYHYDTPEITVSPSRSAASIAADIRSRLLPAAEVWYALATQWLQQNTTRIARIKNLRARLLTYPGAHFSDIGKTTYATGWTVEINSSTATLSFDRLSDEQLFGLLDAYHQIVHAEETMQRPPAPQQEMFPAGEDLPLFAGAPVRPAVKPFRPQVVATQLTAFDLRPAFGGPEPAYTPEPEAQ